MFDDSIPLKDKLDLRHLPPIYQLPHDIKLPSNNIYNNFYLEDVEKSFISKDYENFHNIWRFDGLVPERSKRFYNEFPRVGSNWDGEHHTYNSDYSFILKWFPAFSQNLYVVHWLFPSLENQYFNNIPNSNHQATISAKPSKENTPRANFESNLTHDDSNKKKLFNANPVPTKFERNLCQNLKGNGLYNRKGRWSCYIMNNNVIDLEHDEFGEKFFIHYEDFLNWKKLMKQKIVEAVEKDDMGQVHLIRKISYSE